MTNHSYFNLNGDPSKEGFDQIMYINADKFTPADSLYIPTGEIKSVDGTPMDFRKPAEIGKKVDYNFDQIKNATGYDHNWCLNTYKNGKGDDKTVAQASTHQRAVSFLKYLPTSQAFKVYTGNFQGTGIACKHGIKYPKHVAFASGPKYPVLQPRLLSGVLKGLDRCHIEAREKYCCCSLTNSALKNGVKVSLKVSEPGEISPPEQLTSTKFSQ